MKVPLLLLPAVTLLLLAQGLEGQLTQDEIKQLLDLHNSARASVSPTASNMRKMVWDATIAATAQSYANTCPGGHSTSQQRNGNGENLAWGWPSRSVSSTMNGWVQNEVDDYSYSQNSCSGVCGHYTQVVWASSERLGCGKRRCSSFPGISSNSGDVYVCQYGPAGNNGNRPYTQGASCSQCPSGYSCSGTLCALPSSGDGIPSPGDGDTGGDGSGSGSGDGGGGGNGGLSQGGGGLSSGAIAGIVITVLLLLGIAAGAAFFIVRKRKDPGRTLSMAKLFPSFSSSSSSSSLPTSTKPTAKPAAKPAPAAPKPSPAASAAPKPVSKPAPAAAAATPKPAPKPSPAAPKPAAPPSALPKHKPPPAPLPFGWTEEVDPKSGSKYYYNQKTGATQWERPVNNPRNIH